MFDRSSSEAQAGDRDVVGIVVSSGRLRGGEPRTIAFVWGGEVRPAPSLPFGRWKTAARAA